MREQATIITKGLEMKTLKASLSAAFSAALLALCGCASLSSDEKLSALETRVAKLEESSAKLEKDLAGIKARPQAQPAQTSSSNAKRQFTPEEQAALKKYQALARARMKEDRKLYSDEELKEIETLYQVANNNWNSEEAKESLKKLVAKYSKANRTGCAILYLGQMSGGDEGLLLLQRAIDEFADCYYGDGVNVGVYAKYHMLFRRAKAGEPDKARALAEELKTQHPDALAHGGYLLAPIIDEELPKALEGGN